MSDQSNNRNQPPRPPRKDSAAPTRPPRRSAGDAPARPPRQRDGEASTRPPRQRDGEATRPPRQRDGEASTRPPRQRDGESGTRPPRRRDSDAAARPPRQRDGEEQGRPPSRQWLGNAAASRSKSRGKHTHIANEGTLYLNYHQDPQWPMLQEGAQRALVVMSKHLLQSLNAAGWKVVANHRNDAPEYIFGFDNIWTLRSPDGGRSVELSPEASYRELIYIIAPYGEAPAVPELDRRALTNATMLEQKAKLIARRRLNELTNELANELPQEETPN